MKKLFNAVIILIVSTSSACHLKSTEDKKSGNLQRVVEQLPVKQKTKIMTEHIDELTFVKYIDDGDYFQLLAQKGDSTLSFINETDSSRNLSRGDKIRVTWKDGTVTLPGDGDAEVPAQLLFSVKKIAEGPVSAFRKTYGKKLRYTWSPDEEFTPSYLDKVYLIVEYYLTQTKNPLLQAAVKNRDEITYSIETRERNNRSYKVIGIAPVGENGSHIVQWLYIDEENDRIYEYDLPEDDLVPFD